MSELLSPERLGELEEALQGMSPSEETEEAAPEVEASEEQAEYHDDDAEQEYHDDSEDEYADDEDGHSVPYNRFSQVIAARNELAGEVEQLQAQLEALQNSPPPQQQAPAPEQRDSYADQSHDYDDMADISDPRFAALEGQMHELAVQQEEVKLENELAAVAEQFPDVDQEFLLNAVIDDPETDVLALAQEYTLRVAEIEEAAVARYLADNNLDVSDVDHSVPPEVSGRSAGSQRGVLSQNEKPKTMAEAHSALEQWLSNQ